MMSPHKQQPCSPSSKDSVDLLNLSPEVIQTANEIVINYRPQVEGIKKPLPNKAPFEIPSKRALLAREKSKKDLQ